MTTLSTMILPYHLLSNVRVGPLCIHYLRGPEHTARMDKRSNKLTAILPNKK